MKVKGISVISFMYASLPSLLNTSAIAKNETNEISGMLLVYQRELNAFFTRLLCIFFVYCTKKNLMNFYRVEIEIWVVF